MATIQIIVQGQPQMAIHDVYDFPIVLQFGDQTTYERAVWVLPSYPGRISTRRLSEIRVQDGRLDVLVDGPVGFRYGPLPTDWVRNYYPRGKDCALVQFDPITHATGGVTLRAGLEGLIVDVLSVGPPLPPAAPEPDTTSQDADESTE